MPNVIAQNLDNYLSAYARSWPLSGTVLVAHQGQIIYRNAFGYASIEHQVPNTMDTKFRCFQQLKICTNGMIEEGYFTEVPIAVAAVNCTDSPRNKRLSSC